MYSDLETYKSVESETFLIPRNYRGRVRIIFNQKCGETIKYEDKRRAYDIPNDGNLFTQFKDEQAEKMILSMIKSLTHCQSPLSPLPD
jgi:hypothetical protein